MSTKETKFPTAEQIEEAKSMVESEPDNYLCRTFLGKVLYHLGEPEEAHEEFKRALQLNPDDAYSMFGLAQIYSDKDDPEAAQDYLLTAVELEPDNALFRYALGDILHSLGNLLEARYHLYEACRLEPEYQQAYELLTTIDTHLMTGRPDTSIFVHDRAGQLKDLVHYAGSVQSMVMDLISPDDVYIILNTPKGVFTENHYIVFSVFVYVKGITKYRVEKPVKALMKDTGYPVRFISTDVGIAIEIMPKKAEGD